MKTILKLSCAVAGVAWLAGCVAPVGPNQAGGAVVGGATGAIIGAAAAHHSGQGAVIGGAIGALAGALMGRDIDDSLRTRVVQGQPLGLEDVKALAKAGVGDDLIVNQIAATRTVYRLSTAQIIDLKNAGVSSKVIDFMISTPTAYPPAAPAQGYYYTEPYPYPYYRPYYYAPPVGVYIGPGWYHDHWHRW